MNGKKGSVEIDIIDFPAKTTQLPASEKSHSVVVSSKSFINSIWVFCREDSNRVIFSLKVGFAVLLVSLLILFRAPYDLFGTNIIWAILTVAIMFEYTVGATFNRGFNRALGSLLAGILAIAVAEVALLTGPVLEPVIIGISIFLVGSVTSLMKLWPSLSPYEYGFRVILFTYCLIVVSGYRMGNPLKTAMDRLYSIAIGGFIAVLVNVLIFPIWAGEQLHTELVNAFNSLADSLQECVKKYLEEEEEERSTEKAGMVSKLDLMDAEFPDEPAFKKCKTTLNSSAKLESLAISAKWEPPHGRFRHFFYPWSEYVKVGAVLRYCAYEVMALHGLLHSEIQAPYNLRITFKSEIEDVTDYATELIRSLAKDINNMNQTLKISLLKRVHTAAESLQQAIDTHSYLFTSSINHIDQTDQSSEQQMNKEGYQTATVEAAGCVCVEPMRKQWMRTRQHSWPSRDQAVTGLEQEGEAKGGFTIDILPRMKALESSAAMSVANFTSLLIEFVARLDYLVQTVNELSELAKFKVIAY